MRPRAVLAAVAVVAVVGCDRGERDVPAVLMDGTAARAPSIALEDVQGPTILTRVRLVAIDDADPGSPVAACLRKRARGLHAAGVAVERVGVISESVTLREASARAIFGCDDSPGQREADRRWCGAAYGRLFGGRLRDPRLDLGCSTGGGEPMGFAWVQPEPEARYVVMEEAGYAEVYEVAGGLPVRLGTSGDVQPEESRAGFALSEYDRLGRLLRRYRLEAVVAG